MQDLPEPGAGENQQPQGTGGVRSDHGAAAAFLGRMFGLGLGLVHRIGQSDSLGLPDGLADLRQFRRRQVSFAALFREISIPRQGLKPIGTTCALAAKLNRLLRTRSNRLA